MGTHYWLGKSAAVVISNLKKQDLETKSLGELLLSKELIIVVSIRVFAGTTRHTFTERINVRSKLSD
jgi:hypothetical protein